MSAGRLIRHRRSVVLGGSRYVVRGPTYATVWSAQSTFPAELALLAKSYVEDGEHLTVDDCLDVICIDDNDRRLAVVLSTCVDTDADPTIWPLRKLAELALSLCDLDYVLSQIDLELLASAWGTSRREETETETIEGVAESSVDDEVKSERGLVLLSERFGTTPMDLMEWPFETVMTTIELLGSDTDDVPSGSEYAESGSGHSNRFLALVREQAKYYKKTKPEA